MIKYTVLIPQRDAAPQFARQLPEVCAALERMTHPFEVIAIDDSSERSSQRVLEDLLADEPRLRLLRLDQPRGASVALSAGISAARGKIVIAIDVGDRYPAEQVGRLVGHLTRCDLVCGRRRRFGLAKFWHRVSRIPRWLLLGLDVRDPGCLFWAAHREAVDGLQLGGGMFRYLSALVALRGYRVGDVYVEHRPGNGTRDGWPNPGDLLATWWQSLRWRPYVVSEITARDVARPWLRLSPPSDDDLFDDRAAAA